MSRIDVQTLVLAFEKRIDALEKNPPDKISTSVIINMLEKSIDEEIRNHFIYIIQRDITKAIKKEFSNIHKQLIKKSVENILTDSQFRINLEETIKNKVIKSFEVDNKWR